MYSNRPKENLEKSQHESRTGSSATVSTILDNYGRDFGHKESYGEPDANAVDVNGKIL